MGVTEKSSPIFLSTGNPYLDLFFQVIPITPSNSLINRLLLAWSYNPLTALKLIATFVVLGELVNLIKMALMLLSFGSIKNHPKTFDYNLPTFADFGYFKDFQKICHQIHKPFSKGNKKRSSKKSKSISSMGKEARIHDSTATQEMEK
ncbi:Pyruvate kinase [Bienertia sinuspersici]